MRVLITGICGFVGSSLARELFRLCEGVELFGFDNLSRSGSELNREAFRKQPIRWFHGDLRSPSDLESLPKVDWVIDAAANPSVLAGVDGRTSSRQLIEHNLGGTLNVLEFCKRCQAGLVMLSTSRIYSLEKLCALPLKVVDDAFVPDPDVIGGAGNTLSIAGITSHGVSESFSTEPPLSLYGAAKLASEVVCLEYGQAFGFPVHVNRCGVLAGAGQFGKADQGIFAFWVHSFHARRPLKYVGFGGLGHQVRDCLHPRDLAALVLGQMQSPEKSGKVLNVSGGLENSMSLAQLSRWCAKRFGPHNVSADTTQRQFDVPWLVLDSAQAATEWNWKPTTRLESILDELAVHAEQNPDWLDLSQGA